jgi:hypothetical protein
MDALDEGQVEIGGEDAELLQDYERDRDQQRDSDLPEDFGARGEAEVAAFHDFDVIVGESDGAESDGGSDDEPDEGISGIGPEDRRQQDGDGDEHAAHGGCAGLLLVRFGAVFADVLADLKLAQFFNDERAYEQSDHERGERGERSAEGEIAEDAEWMKVGEKLLI